MSAYFPSEFPSAAGPKSKLYVVIKTLPSGVRLSWSGSLEWTLSRLTSITTTPLRPLEAAHQSNVREGILKYTAKPNI